MLNRLSYCNASVPSAPIQTAAQENKYNRNEKEDMKKAIEFLYEFAEKLRELHPNCTDMIENMLVRARPF